MPLATSAPAWLQVHISRLVAMDEHAWTASGSLRLPLLLLLVVLMVVPIIQQEQQQIWVRARVHLVLLRGLTMAGLGGRQGEGTCFSATSTMRGTARVRAGEERWTRLITMMMA